MDKKAKTTNKPLGIKDICDIFRFYLRDNFYVALGQKQKILAILLESFMKFILFYVVLAVLAK